MRAHPGPYKQHLLLAREEKGTRARRRRLFAELTALGWERQPPVFAVPTIGNTGWWRGIRVREQVNFGTDCQAYTPQGRRMLSLRTLGTDFTLVTGERLRKGGLDQLVYSLGYALDGGQPRGDVLLAEGWARTRTANFEAFLEAVDRWFADVRAEVVEEEPSLQRVKCCASGLRDAAA
ncbi:hypothetical protein ACQEV2_41995 [Streptomyces sp. CA-251387]|uniref:hypothetical protein n=1 Tax=Streptomyces sp. CA-251387 TaxID=3240064 RepID=UPI003D9031DB